MKKMKGSGKEGQIRRARDAVTPTKSAKPGPGISSRGFDAQVMDHEGLRRQPQPRVGLERMLVKIRQVRSSVTYMEQRIASRKETARLYLEKLEELRKVTENYTQLNKSELTYSTEDTEEDLQSEDLGLFISEVC